MVFIFGINGNFIAGHGRLMGVELIPILTHIQISTISNYQPY